jgi:4-hydroxy-tetrahydrodipicolinate synthase
MTSLQISGSYTALVTPFTPDGESVDVAAFDALLERQIAGGISGLIPSGTTGESPTLTESEQVLLVKRCVEIAKGRVPVFAGTGTFSTKKTIEASRRAMEAGATGVMVVMPYYSKPTQEGLFQHVVAVAKSVDAPIILYNIPGRSSVDLLPETTERICAAAANVVATKEATGNVLRAQELKRRLGDRLTVMSGDDGLTLAMMSVGAKGVISVTSNLYPDKLSEVTSLALANRWDEARAAHFRLIPVHEAMFIESNPGPAKAYAASKGWMNDTVRLPLVPPGAATRAKVTEILGAYEAGR